MNYYAPDGYRYGVMYADGSVSNVWNGRTQQQRAREEAIRVVVDHLTVIGRCDAIRLVRRAPNGEWKPVPAYYAEVSDE